MPANVAEPPRNRGLWISWIPLAVGCLTSYGPVGYNYGFALYFLNYRHGFVKRGLIGELFTGVSRFSRGELLAVEYVFLAVAFGLTYMVFRELFFGSSEGGRLGAVLFCGPALLPHLGYLFAQPDVTLYVLVVLCVWVFLRASPVVAACVTLPLCWLGILAHEAFSLMFYPLVAAMLLHLCCRQRLRLWIGVLHVVLTLAVFAAVVHWGRLPISADALIAEAQARSAVPVQRQLYDVMASSLQEQRTLVRQMYSPAVVRVLALSLLLSAPYFYLLARFLRRAMTGAGCGRAQRMVTYALFLCPLLLCFLGHDTTRWIGAACIDASLFVVFLFLEDGSGVESRGALSETLSSSEVLPWLAYLVAIGPYGATGLRSAEQLLSAWYGP